MNDEIHSFISDLLHRRGLVDRDSFAQRAAASLGKLKAWNETAIRTSINHLRSDIYRRSPEWTKQMLVDLVADRVIRKWPTPPRNNRVADVEDNKIKILFVSSNPVDIVTFNPATGVPLTHVPLGVDHEYREVKNKLRASKCRDRFQLISCPAAQPDDLLDAFNEELPQIVHFSGHGSKDAIVMLDANGKAKLVSRTALGSLFRVMKNNIRVVVLNACFSQAQATAITKHIDCAIGMSKEIGDQAAIKFAAAFYNALAHGVSVKNAFDQGLVSLQVNNIKQDTIPKLMTRSGVDANKVTLV